jgi:hypothetical protein
MLALNIKRGPFTSDIIEYNASKGYLAILCYIEDRLRRYVSSNFGYVYDIIKCAAKNGQLNVLQYYKSFVEKQEVMNIGIQEGHLNVVKWIYETYPIGFQYYDKQKIPKESPRHIEIWKFIVMKNSEYWEEKMTNFVFEENKKDL